MTNPPSAWLRPAGQRLATLWPFKLVGISAGMTVFFLAYFQLLHHPVRPPIVMPLTALDRVIPFQPATLPLYLSLWVYVSLAPALAANLAQLRSYFLGALGLALTGLGLFYVCPTAVPPAGDTWDASSAFAFLKQVDASGNACPSLHVAFAVFTAFVVARHLRKLDAGRTARGLNWLWCVGIAYSTLATRQHVFIDVVGGALLGAIFGGLFVRGASFGRTPTPAGPPQG